MENYAGRIVSVYFDRAGGEVMADCPAGTQVIPVGFPIDFDGALSTGWSKGGFFRYKLTVEGNLALSINFVQTDGTNNTDGSTIVSAANGLPSAYRPPRAWRLPVNTNAQRVASGSNDEAPAVVVNTDGSITALGIAASATRIDLPWGEIPLDTG